MPEPTSPSSNPNVDESPVSFDQAKAQIESHIEDRARQQEVVTQTKPGQRPAEETILGAKRQDGVKSELPDSPEQRTKALMGLVELTKYDDVSKEDVTKIGNGGQDLSDPQMWNLVAGNAKFMDNIQPGLTVNKILPDGSINTVLTHKQTYQPQNGPGSSQLNGSVADERYYEGLSGPQAIANFGLDYGGYSAGTVKSDKVSDGGGGDPSSYVIKGTPDQEGRTLKSVPNVFFVKVKVPDSSLDQVKVPVHPNVANWATNKLKEVDDALADPPTIKALAEQAGGSEQEMIAKLEQKKKTLETFSKNSKVDNNMLTTLSPDGTGFVKNKEDPLTNMGMTKPSNRLQTDFETINQEYHLQNRFDIPEGSGLYLKDAQGKDHKVGELVKNSSGGLEWGKLETETINKKLTENQGHRDLGKVVATNNLEPVEKTPSPVQAVDSVRSKLLEGRSKLKATQEPLQPKLDENTGVVSLKEKLEALKTPEKVAPKVEKMSELEEAFAQRKERQTSVRDQLGKSSPSVKPKENEVQVKMKGPK